MNYENIILEKNEGIAWLTLNRPSKLNAMTYAMLREFDSAIEDVRNDSSIKVLVIKGAGRSFCSGNDWTDTEHPQHEVLSPTEVMREEQADGTRQMERWLRLWDLPKAVIAQVHGYCLAAGCGMAMMADITIAAEDAQIGFPIARTGSSSQHQWPWHIGAKRTKELLFTARNVTGKEAERMDMINRAVPADKLEEEVRTLAKKITEMPVELIALHKRATNRTFEIMGFRNALNYGIELHGYGHFTQASEDFHKTLETQGVKAALASRDGGRAKQKE